MTRYDSLGEHMIDSLAVISELKFWLGDGTSNCALPPQSSNLIKGWRSIPFPLVLRRKYFLLQPRAEVIMQNGSVVRGIRKMQSDIWQFRWREKTADGKKIYRRRQIGTIDQIPDIETARKVASLLVPDPTRAEEPTTACFAWVMYALAWNLSFV